MSQDNDNTQGVGYREGNQDNPPQEKEENSEGKVVSLKSDGEEIKEIPEFAFLVVSYAGGKLEAATDIPNLKMKQQANLRNIRDACHALYCDVSTTLMSKAASMEVAMQIGEATKQAQIRQLAMQHSGRGNSGRRR